MESFLAFATGWPVGILSLPLCLLAIWWAVSLLGVVDFDPEFDVDIETGSGPLVWAGIGQVPLKVGLTVWFVFSWIVVCMLAAYVSPILPLAKDNLIMQIIEGSYAFIALAVTMPATKIAVKPLIPIFAIKEGPKNSDMVGCEGVVVSPEITETYGDVEVKAENGHRARISAVTYTNESFQKGDKVVVVSFEEDKQKYIVTKTTI